MGLKAQLFGFKAARSNHSIRLVAVGPFAGQHNNSWPNMFVGYNAGGSSSDITGSNITGVGYNALKSVTSGSNNTALGNLALALNTTGDEQCSCWSRCFRCQHNWSRQCLL